MTKQAEFEKLLTTETDDHVLWPGRAGQKYGYLRINGRTTLAHREALLRRVAMPEPGLIACHAPGIGCPKNCINYRHLRWDTQRGNLADRQIDKTELLGTNNGRAVLDERSVRIIRERHASGESQDALALAYGIGQTQVSRIIRRVHWGWVT